MGPVAPQLGYSAILRWRHDPTRDEARNVAVILVDREGQFGALKSAPISSISPQLHEQGILDAILEGLRQKVVNEPRLNLLELESMQQSMQLSVVLSKPKPVLVDDPNKTIEALYKAYVAPRQGGTTVGKGQILDRLVSAYRRRGFDVKRAARLDDFLFDAIIELPRRQRQVAEVLTFQKEKKHWEDEERAAGHFLYGIERLKLSGFAVIQPPADSAFDETRESHERISKWFRREKIKILAPADLNNDHLPHE